MSEKRKTPTPKVEEYIDKNLKRVFSEVEKEEVPDRFKDLLNRLRAQDQDPPTDT